VAHLLPKLQNLIYKKINALCGELEEQQVVLKVVIIHFWKQLYMVKSRS